MRDGRDWGDYIRVKENCYTYRENHGIIKLLSVQEPVINGAIQKENGTKITQKERVETQGNLFFTSR